VNVKAALVRNTAWYGLVTLVGVGSGLLTSVLLARGLGPQRMGDYSYVTWAWAMLDAVATLGFALATARYTAAASARGDRASAAGLARYFRHRQILATALVVSVATPLVLWLAPAHLRWPLVVVVLALFPITLESIDTHALYGAQRYDVTARLSTLKMSLQLVVVVTALALGTGIVGIVGGLALTLVISCGLVRRSARRVYPEAPVAVPAGQRADMRTYLIALSIVAVLDAIVWDRSEVFFLGLWGSAHDIAFYSLAFGLATRAMIIPEIAVGALLPAFSALHGAGNRSDFEAVYRTALRYVALAGALTAALTAALAPGIIVLLYGEPYLPAAALLSALAGVALVSALRQVAWAALPALGDRRSALAATTTAAAVNLGLAALLIRSHGTTGAVIANAVGQLIATVWVFVALARRHGYRFPAADLTKIATAAALAFLAAKQAGTGLDQLVLGAVAGAIVFGVVCRLGRVVGRGEWSAILARLRTSAAPPAGAATEGSRAIATRQDAGLSRE
jgi:O-antigen/teichoic acid export membrane protein